MKDGPTHLAHLAHKVEHVVDLGTGAIVGVTVQDAERTRPFSTTPERRHRRGHGSTRGGLQNYSWMTVTVASLLLET